MNDFHYSPCNAIAFEPNNKYFVTGGNDSLIAKWNTNELMVTNTISNNDHKVIALNISHDG
jgi:WD40 repeat protein